jgi:hypothetical protein
MPASKQHAPYRGQQATAKQTTAHHPAGLPSTHLELQQEGYVGLVGLEAAPQNSPRLQQRSHLGHMARVIPASDQARPLVRYCLS